MLESRVDRLEAALARLTEALAHLAIRVDALAERVETLTARVDELARQMTALAAAMTRLATDVGDLKGDVLELRYRQHLNASFQDILRRLRPVSDEELGRLVEDARQRKALTDDEAAELLRSDLVALGRRPSDGAWPRPPERLRLPRWQGRKRHRTRARPPAPAERGACWTEPPLPPRLPREVRAVCGRPLGRDSRVIGRGVRERHARARPLPADLPQQAPPLPAHLARHPTRAAYLFG